jgi:3-oxoacyl-[acyl-carrier-protein] synthase-3
VEAVRRALTAAELSPRDVDFILCATSSPDHPMPATASLIQNRLGLPAALSTSTPAVAASRTASSWGLPLAAHGAFSRVVVVGADTYSRLLNWSDRQSAVFFGDGAGAAVVGPVAGSNWLLAAASGSDGGAADLITVPAGGSRFPATADRIASHETCFRMNGRVVWDFVMERIPAVVRTVVDRAGIRLQDVDLLIPHQANGKLIRALGHRLGMADDRVFVDIEHVANTAAASLPIALDEAVRTGRIRRGAYVVLVAFGAASRGPRCA